MEELKIELEDLKKIMNRYPENEELKKFILQQFQDEWKELKLEY